MDFALLLGTRAKLRPEYPTKWSSSCLRRFPLSSAHLWRQLDYGFGLVRVQPAVRKVALTDLEIWGILCATDVHHVRASRREATAHFGDSESSVLFGFTGLTRGVGRVGD